MKRPGIRFFSLDGFMTLLTIVGIITLLISYFSPYTDPRDFKLIPLFGLAYPFILLANFILLVYWVLRRRWKITITMIIVLLIGIPLHNRIFATSGSTTNDDKKFVSIMSYNVRLFDVYDWFGRGYETRNDIMAFLKSQDTDIICFQEFYYENKPTNFNTTDTIIHLLQSPHKYGRYTSGAKGTVHFGVMTFSKYPIINSGYIDINSVASNHCIYTDIKKDSIIFRVYNLHIGSIQIQDDEYDLFSEKPNTLEDDKTERSKRLIGRVLAAYRTRIEQAESILEHSKNSPYPVIICGDFNDTPASYTYNQFYKLYNDAFLNGTYGIGTTYAGKIPANRIDFIFHDNFFNTQSFEIQEEILSDHRAIWATLEVSE